MEFTKQLGSESKLVIILSTLRLEPCGLLPRSSSRLQAPYPSGRSRNAGLEVLRAGLIAKPVTIGAHRSCDYDIKTNLQSTADIVDQCGNVKGPRTCLGPIVEEKQMKTPYSNGF